MDEDKKQLLSDIFWEMNSISSRSESHSETEITETDDGNGNIVQTETTVTRTTLYITVSHLTVDEMADLYGFDAEQREYLAELLKDENNSIWAAVLYGIRYSDEQIVMTDIRCKAMWAQNSRETLRTQLLAREQSASVERTRTLQAELNAIGKRLPELDKLIQSAYEDKVLGRIPESVCVNLLNQYEAERREKQERRKELTEQLAARLETESSVDAWLDMMQDYAQLEELDRPTLVRLIQKIEISERYTVDDHEERNIHIYYNFVGYIEA